MRFTLKFNLRHVILSLLCGVMLAGSAFAVVRQRVVHTFAGTPLKTPASGFVAGASGNLFGVATNGIYELSPSAGGGWQYRTIAQTLGPSDLAGGTLARDSAGNLYGATWQGGPNSCGYIYQLSPGTSGNWTLNVLHDFTCTDGAQATYSMVFDGSGNLFGAGHGGGANGQGVVFELRPGTGGTWTYSVIHDFTSPEGNGPQTGLTFDSHGNLYGGNELGIFKLTPGTSGAWTESMAYLFNTADGGNPEGDLTWDAAGNLYGTNQAGGIYLSGTAYMLTPTSGGGWTSTVLHSFNFQDYNDGFYPLGGLTLDPAGNIYGTALAGGGPGNNGIVFRLTPGGSGTWTHRVVYRFGANGNPNGTSPQFTLYRNAAGHLLGAATGGGNAACNPPNGCGLIYELIVP